MLIVQRKVRQNGHPVWCSNPGCHHSARFQAIWLGTEYDALCTKCAATWREAYDNALSNWGLEAHEVAEQYREVHAA